MTNRTFSLKYSNSEHIMNFMTVIICLFLIAFVNAIPSHRNIRETNEHINYVGQASRVITASILKHNINNKNLVFSPFGFSTILTILSEGARGESYKEIYELLKHSADIEKVRGDYNEVLKRYKGDNPLVAPQFKTWFYIYRNNTVESIFRDSLRDYYHVEVKDINREVYDWTDPKTSEDPVVTVDNSKDILGFEDLKKSETIDDKTKSESFDDKIKTEEKIVEEPSVVEEIEAKLDPVFEDEPVKEENNLNEENLPIEENEEVIKKECSKFDQDVEDKQYVEVPLIKKEISDNKLAEKKETIEDNETIRSDEKVDEKKSIIEESDEPTRIRLPLKKLEDLEIMQAVENHPIRKRFYGRSLNGDLASAISGNSLVGEKYNSDNKTEDKNESKMLLFNGLYFRGSWDIPFQQLRSDPEDVFYISSTEKQPVTMMRSRGSFKTGIVPKWNSNVIELMYENKRNSFMIVLPETQDDFNNLLENFKEDTLSDIAKYLEPASISLSVPKFRMESTSRVEKELIKCGLKTVFTPNADFGGISKEQKLHLDELVQHVSLRVDEGASSENFLTATGALHRNVELEKAMIVNKPFLYFVRDVIDDIIIVAGKFMSPQVDQDDKKFGAH